MKVILIPALTDNYEYLVIDETTNVAAIIDPVNPEAVEKVLAVAKQENVILVAAFVTHHHTDHATGTVALQNATKDIGLKIYAGETERIKAVSKVVNHKDEFKVGNLKVVALLTPPHTCSHFCYVISDENNGETAVFTGDCLFSAGCGLFNEGPPELRAAQMHDSINVQLAALPDDTKVYPGHEYTVPNLQFAMIIDPNNPSVKERLQWAENKRKHGEPTIPSTIGKEKTFNPFMRVHNTEIQKRIGAENTVDAMAKLRQMKNEIHIDFLRDSINWKPEDDIIFK
ncbi:metallo-beta-lactamase superfamily domain-containing protein [Ditylenchus destructor]|nr:metallo-beta-lactamase superfamily domain-containing protein [Ditylenchus destructor]